MRTFVAVRHAPATGFGMRSKKVEAMEIGTLEICAKLQIEINAT